MLPCGTQFCIFNLQRAVTKYVHYSECILHSFYILYLESEHGTPLAMLPFPSSAFKVTGTAYENFHFSAGVQKIQV